MRKLLASMVVLAGASLVVPALAADPMAPSGDPSGMQQGQMNSQSSQLNKSDLVGRKVLDSKGKQVGQVKDVITDPQGAPLNVIVTTAKKDVSLSPDEIKLASNDTVKANLSATQINKLPAAPAASDSGATGSTMGSGPMNGSGSMNTPSNDNSTSAPAPATPKSNY